MQIKATRRYLPNLLKQLSSRRQEIASIGKNVEKSAYQFRIDTSSHLFDYLLDGHSLPLQSNREFTLPFIPLWEAQGNYL